MVSGSTTETVQTTVRVEAPLRLAQFFLDEMFVSAFAASGFAQLGTQCQHAVRDPWSLLDGSTCLRSYGVGGEDRLLTMLQARR